MSWGSADLMPTSQPLRSEWALGSVVPFALSSSQTQGHSITRGSLNQERGDAEFGGKQAAASDRSSNSMQSHPIQLALFPDVRAMSSARF
jgi:hypothetical protein